MNERNKLAMDRVWRMRIKQGLSRRAAGRRRWLRPRWMAAVIGGVGVVAAASLVASIGSAPASPRELTSDQVNRLAVTRFRNYQAGGRAVTIKVPGTAGGLIITGSIDYRAVAPATFNTINKWAAGISDTLALGILCEAYGLGISTAVLPYVNAAMASHPAYSRSLEQLREMRVLIGSHRPHPPKTEGAADRFRWEEALELLAPAISARG
ncbi:flavoprotein [Streptomyces scopuliridis]|uniref:flavoprotein n=1 Tax=Streptomyces scopuliridis TaxID=452529 RepID=UPI00368609C3